IVEQNGPCHRKFDGHAGGEHGFGGEPDASARDVDRLAGSGFGDALSVQHFVADILLNVEAPLYAAFTLALRHQLVVLTLSFKHPDLLIQNAIWIRSAQDVFGYLGSDNP